MPDRMPSTWMLSQQQTWLEENLKTKSSLLSRNQTIVKSLLNSMGRQAVQYSSAVLLSAIYSFIVLLTLITKYWHLLVEYYPTQQH